MTENKHKLFKFIYHHEENPQPTDNNNIQVRTECENVTVMEVITHMTNLKNHVEEYLQKKLHELVSPAEEDNDD